MLASSTVSVGADWRPRPRIDGRAAAVTLYLMRRCPYENLKHLDEHARWRLPLEYRASDSARPVQIKVKPKVFSMPLRDRD